MQLIRCDLADTPGSFSRTSFFFLYISEKNVFSQVAHIPLIQYVSSDMYISIIYDRNTQFKLNCDASCVIL